MASVLTILSLTVTNFIPILATFFPQCFPSGQQPTGTKKGHLPRTNNVNVSAFNSKENWISNTTSKTEAEELKIELKE